MDCLMRQMRYGTKRENIRENKVIKIHARIMTAGSSCASDVALSVPQMRSQLIHRISVIPVSRP